ncbi:MAG: hypothetical protein U0704_16085 [Candidatus Eisenbacteria bacterium]
MHHRRDLLVLLAFALLVVFVPGPGDRRLWLRWCAERDLWKLRAEAARLPGHSGDSTHVRTLEARAARIAVDGSLGGCSSARRGPRPNATRRSRAGARRCSPPNSRRGAATTCSPSSAARRWPNARRRSRRS